MAFLMFILVLLRRAAHPRGSPGRCLTDFVKHRKSKASFHGDIKMSVNLQSKTLIDNWVEQVSARVRLGECGYVGKL